MKTVIISLSIVAVLIVGFFGYLIVSDLMESEKDVTTNTNSIDEIRESTGGSVTDEQLESYKDKGLNPFGQIKTIDELTDADYQEYIHGMSHQKVKADEKWGFYQINPERINWLLEGLNILELHHKDVYSFILEKWAKGDFSSVDDDHNTIWELQGGTIGKATGVLTVEEEEAYIKTQQ